MARRTKQDAEETRKNILKAALDIIYEKGYARSTFVDIAKEIKLTKGAVYWHFKSKPEMFLALSRQMEKRNESMSQNMFDKTDTLMELKEMLFEMILLTAEDEAFRKYYTIVFYRMEWTEELLTIKQFFDHQNELMLGWIADVLRHARSENEIPRDSNIHHLSKALYGFFGGLLSYCLSATEKDKGIISEIVETGLDTFFNGLASRKEAPK